MDVIANALTSVLNGQRVGKKRVAVPYSKNKEALMKFLARKGVIAHVKTQESPKNKLVVTLAYDEKGNPAIHGIRRYSKPGLRKYAHAVNMPYFKKGSGFIVVSTSQGIMDAREAKKKGIGGEIICTLW